MYNNLFIELARLNNLFTFIPKAYNENVLIRLLRGAHNEKNKSRTNFRNETSIVKTKSFNQSDTITMILKINPINREQTASELIKCY